MAISYASIVKKNMKYILARLGNTIRYKRLQAPGTWTPTGTTDILWEDILFSAIVYDVKTNDIDRSGGRLELGDKAFAFMSNVFSSYTNCEYIKFTSGSSEPMVGEQLTGATSGATANVVGWYEDSGAWADGDAVGVIWVNGVSGTFGASEDVNGSVSGSGIATTTATNVSGGTDEVRSKAGDKIIYNDITYYVAFSETDFSSDVVLREDVTGSTITIWARSKDG